MTLRSIRIHAPGDTVARGRLGGLAVALLLAAAAKTGCTDADLSAPGAPQGTATVERPNVVLVVADDQGWGDLSHHGNTNLATPNLDALLTGGASFDNFYVSAVCSPTRAELLTGRHALELGVTGTGSGKERMDTAATTLPEVLAGAGYATGLFGKWHNGAQGPYHPLSRGFDEFYGFTSGHWGQYSDYFIEEGDSLTRFGGYLPDVLTTRAIDFIAEHRGEPTFAMLAFPTPHSPMQVPGEWYDPVAARALDSFGRRGPAGEDTLFTTAALAMVENLDHNVGRLLAALDSLGLAEETLVVYLTDNGPNSWRWNGGMAGKKGTLDEGGLRSPLALYQPGRIAAGTPVEEIAGARDLMPTLLGYLDIADTVDYRAIDPLGNVDLSPLLAGPAGVGGAADSLRAKLASRMLAGAWRDDVTIRHGDYRLMPDGVVYDLAADRGQGVAAEPGVAGAMREARDAFLTAYTSRVPPADIRPFAIGGGATRRTLLPARDAEPAPGSDIERSSRWPNDSYFRPWTDTAAALAWSVDVLEPGRYGATLYYALAEGGAGTEVEIRAGGGARLRYVLAEAHPVADRGPADDRYPREGEESAVRDWAAVELGEIDLVRGEQILTLASPEMPAGEGPAVWTLVLERVGDEY